MSARFAALDMLIFFLERMMPENVKELYAAEECQKKSAKRTKTTPKEAKQSQQPRTDVSAPEQPVRKSSRLKERNAAAALKKQCETKQPTPKVRPQQTRRARWVDHGVR